MRRLFVCTALTDRFLQPRRNVFTARYERMPVFNLSSIHLIFVLEKVALGQGFHRLLRFSPVSITTSMLHTVLRSSTCFCYEKYKRAKPVNLLNMQHSFRNREASDCKEQLLCPWNVTAFSDSSLCTSSQTTKLCQCELERLYSHHIRNWQPLDLHITCVCRLCLWSIYLYRSVRSSSTPKQKKHTGV